jgi:hypothetical protein
VEFAVAYQDNDYNGSATGRELWPSLGYAAQKGSQWARREGVKVALRAVEERDKHKIRVLMEANGAGEERRMEVVAGIINGFGKSTPSDKLKSIEYADKREGRVTEEKHGVAVNVFTAVATGNGHLDPNRPDTGFCGVRTAVSVCPEQDVWPSAVSSMADAVAPGTGEDTP